ncbi:bifunctional phosphoribosyl-AMP cyclohydrolase/phosphoribosyl-ATP diphosphatase HisIE [Patescibacteria group bacterium]|nr:bifunctional phosphoribosyl-AMP cyclohydrolase/phosphoribosyl-ATP diphosphatase HisIE [Patescibacteria group bacterium]
MITPSSLDWQKNPDGLLPAIVQDSDTAQVLMLGYMNQEALEKTLKTKMVTFYSRSKKRLWMKGETSGNILEVATVCPDCDKDSILIQARPKGPTCHNGTRSCFEDGEELPLETLGLLIRTIDERALAGSEASYTKKLLIGGLEAYGAKVLEESIEVVKAAEEEGRQRTVEEVSDLLYHLFVLLRGEGIEIGEISEELRKRRK